MKELRENLVKILDRETKQKPGQIQGVTVLGIVSCFRGWGNSICIENHPINQGTHRKDCPYCWQQL